MAKLLTVGAPLVQGVSGLLQGFAENRTAKQMAARNRQIGEANAELYQRQTSRDMASARARLGASGIDPSKGSVAASMEDFAAQSELQRLRILNNAEVLALRTEQSGRNALIGGVTGAVGSGMRAGSLLLDKKLPTFSDLPNTYRYPQSASDWGINFGRKRF